MSEAPPEHADLRVLVLAPTAKDAETTRALLGGAGFEPAATDSVADLCRQIEAGAAALLLTEDALTAEGMALLREHLGRQPAWSDLPVLVLTRGSSESARAALALETLGNVTLLDRPVRIAMLVSAVRTAVRARQRQYLLREHLAEQERIREALRFADRAKDEFLAMLAHELRGPLASIVTAAAVLGHLEVSLPAAERQQAVIERQARHMARLLDDLLDVSRITQGRIELRKQPVELNDLMAQVVVTCRPMIQEHGQELTVSPSPDPLPLQADPARLEQILGNLLTNAAKYTPRGGHVWLSAVREGDEAVVRVRDSGAGISADLLPRIFDLFTQAERTLARSEGGLGIGLTMVRRLTELHGGRVAVRSDGVGKGAEFEVRLPIAECGMRNADRETRDAGQEEAVGSGTGGSCNPQPAIRIPQFRRVLIVEDNRDAAESLGELLELWGHQVKLADTGEGALELARVFRPEVVLLDIGLPGMNGYEVAARLRAAPELNGARLVALSGYGQQEDRRRSAAAGFDAHLTKPVDPAVLRSLLAGAEDPGQASPRTPQSG